MRRGTTECLQSDLAGGVMLELAIFKDLVYSDYAQMRSTTWWNIFGLDLEGFGFYKNGQARMMPFMGNRWGGGILHQKALT